MKPTQVLKEEHQVILKGLECLEKVISLSSSSGKVDEEISRKIIDFIQNFADKTHHSKEEDQLFESMASNGFPREAGPIGCMMNEHDMGRKYIGNMLAALDNGASQGDEEALKKFTYNGNNFVLMLRDHIFKEDNVLFPMADDNLPVMEQELLWNNFLKVEEQAGGCRHRHYIEFVKEICQTLEIPFLKEHQYETLTREFTDNMGRKTQS